VVSSNDSINWSPPVSLTAYGQYGQALFDGVGTVLAVYMTEYWPSTNSFDSDIGLTVFGLDQCYPSGLRNDTTACYPNLFLLPPALTPMTQVSTQTPASLPPLTPTPGALSIPSPSPFTSASGLKGVAVTVIVACLVAQWI